MKRILAIMLSALVLSACGLPKESLERSKAVKADAEATTKIVATELAAFDAWLKSEDAKPFAATAKREEWRDKYFLAANAATESAKSRFEKEVDPLLKRNSSDDSGRFESAVDGVAAETLKAKRFLDSYRTRKTAMEGIRANAPKLIAESEATVSGMKPRTSQFLAQSARAAVDFPIKKEALAELTAKAEAFLETAETALKRAKSELSKSSPDYGAAADAFATIALADKESKAHCEGQTKRIGTLATSHSKTLIDMRVDYFATVTRTSWNESSDWTTDQDYAYRTVQIDADTAKALDNPHWEENPVSTASYGWLSGHDVLVNGGIWPKLGVNDLWENRPSSHDRAEYYVDTSEKYYHRYRIERDGKVEETGWVEVNESSFESLEDFLGMAIVSKAYGTFEDEAVKIPTPEGMEFVGNPVYGSWKSDGSGGSFWNWYGQYAFIRDALDGHSYSRKEWEDWRGNYRGKKPYYGPDDEDDRYGTGGSVTGGSGRYQKTEYYRANPGERYRTDQVAGTHRESGPANRGRGPGGSGK